jgi:SnoaL-like domain
MQDVDLVKFTLILAPRGQEPRRRLEQVLQQGRLANKEDLMAGSEPERIINDWATAWSPSNSGDPERVLALFADDCVFEDVTFGVVARGKDELRAFANRAFAAVPDFGYGLTSRFATSQ